MAQDDPIYAPCLMQFPAPSEFADMTDWIAAMEDAGWNHRTWEMMRTSAAPPLAEISIGSRFLPSPFRNAAEAQDFADRALTAFEPSMSVNEIFTRGDLSAAVSTVELDPGVISVLCTFAGPSVPDADAIFAIDERSMDEIGISMGFLEPDLPDNAVSLDVTAIRFNGSDTVLAPITGREGITVAFEYTLPG
ncbi:hypothetical protein KUL25_19225 [Rhodobacteraceae bacterium N5(2021)]|uniref:Uncharacterized protein n=1 Tax=Gymnodinialimonas phycosphaerae TaxID=2841589 RepID=A0A975YFJ8_9RHOB|nr:hypothetical protein [Gymnodinialimonas phycosphaerae]MBY4894896.1 hypothetical protein [Gymnodinialimonas phycosphaerae]